MIYFQFPYKEVSVEIAQIQIFLNQRECIIIVLIENINNKEQKIYLHGSLIKKNSR